MKRLLCFVTSIPLVSIVLQAQTVQTISFSTLQPKYKLVVPYKSHLQIRLTDINRKIYKVEDATTSEDFNTTLPDALKGIKLPSFLFSLPAASDESKQLQQTASASGEAAAVNMDMSQISDIINQLIGDIETHAERLNEAVLYYNNINHISRNCSTPPTTIISSVQSATLGFLYHSTTDPASGSSISDRLLDTLQNQRSLAQNSLRRLKKVIELYQSTMETAVDSKITNLNTGISEIEHDLEAAASGKEKQRLKEELAKRNTLLEKFKAEKDHLEKTIGEMKDTYKEAKDTVDDMLEFEKDDKLNPIYMAYKTYTNSKNYEYISVVMIPDKDETKLTLTITPQDLNECTAADKQSTEIKIRTQGGVKLDVSTGAFINSGNNTFLGNTYYYEKINSDSSKIVTAGRNNRLMLSVGALLHVYRRSPALFKLAGSAGVSLTADFSDLNFHAGPSLIIGDKNRLILTAGLTLKSSKVLDQGLETGKVYSNLKIPDEVPTVSVFPKAGWFAAITYNINILK